MLPRFAVTLAAFRPSMPSGKSICCHHPSHRFRCVVSAVLQIRWQSIWPRSQGTKPSSHVGRCSLLKAVLIFIIECVCPAQQDTFVMTNVQRFCRLTGFHFTDYHWLHFEIAGHAALCNESMVVSFGSPSFWDQSASDPCQVCLIAH